MSAIDLYQVLKKIPEVTDQEAKLAADGTMQTDRLQRIEDRLQRLDTELAELRAEFRTTSRITLGLLLTILAILLAPLFQ